MQMPENTRSPIMDEEEIRLLETQHANEGGNRAERRRKKALERRAA